MTRAGPVRSAATSPTGTAPPVGKLERRPGQHTCCEPTVRRAALPVPFTFITHFRAVNVFRSGSTDRVCKRSLVPTRHAKNLHHITIRSKIYWLTCRTCCIALMLLRTSSILKRGYYFIFQNLSHEKYLFRCNKIHLIKIMLSTKRKLYRKTV